MTCLLCGSKNVEQKFIFSGDDLYMNKLGITDFELKWFACNDCKVLFSKQYKDIDKVYEDDTLYDATYNEDMLLDRFNKIMSLPDNGSDNFKRVSRVKEYLYNYRTLISNKKEQYSVLDIGAGMGVFLARLLEDKSFLGSAVELNPVAVRHIKRVVSSVDVFQNYLENINFKEKFDLITLNRVLEHIIDPVKFLKVVTDKLESNGLLYIELPDSFSYDLDGSSNEAFASGHYMVYNASALDYLCKEVNIEKLSMSRVKEPSGKFTIYLIGRKIEIL